MNIGIIGQGRFGKLLAEILSPHFSTKICDTEITPEVLAQEVIFIAVPIRHFETTIRKIAPQLGQNHTVIDVCSVKVIPTEIMEKHLPQEVDIIATHPLFGPDSFNQTHTNKIMMAKIRDQHQRYSAWKDFFASKEIDVVEMSPDEHDRYMAHSQNITHLLGRALAEMKIKPTPINTAGFDQLLTIMKHTCNDSLELFYDLQDFNPYSPEVSQALIHALEKLSNPQKN